MQERLVALAVLAASLTYLALALPLPRGTPERPGAGFFPLAGGVFLCVTAAAFALASFRRPAHALAPPPEVRARVYATAGGLVGFCLLLPWTGYPLVAFGFVALLLRRLGDGGWTAALATAFVSAIASYYLFAVLLGVPLPRGPWLD